MGRYSLESKKVLLLAASILTLPMAGCTSVSHPAVASNGEHLTGPVKVRINAGPAGEKSTPLAEQVGQALAQSLVRRGVRIADDANYTLNVAVAQRSAAVGIAQEGAVAGAKPNWLSQSDPQKPFWNCDQNRLRVTVLGETANSDSKPLVAQGEIANCRRAGPAIDALADALAQQLTGAAS